MSYSGRVPNQPPGGAGDNNEMDRHRMTEEMRARQQQQQQNQGKPPGTYVAGHPFMGAMMTAEGAAAAAAASPYYPAAAQRAGVSPPPFVGRSPYPPYMDAAMYARQYGYGAPPAGAPGSERYGYHHHPRHRRNI